MEYNIWLSLMIDEVVSSENHSFASTNGTINYLTDNVKERINTMIDEKLQNTISLMQTKHYDILNVYEKFNAFKYRKFQEYIDTLEDDEYMSDMTFRINLKLNYVI
jgi:tRNA A37 N6-isopentenylltransferase MiaA